MSKRLRSDITPEEFVKAVQQGGGVLGYAGPDVLALFEEVEEAPSGPPSYAALLASFEEMTDEAAALRAKVAELEADKVRLDTLEHAICGRPPGAGDWTYELHLHRVNGVVRCDDVGRDSTGDPVYHVIHGGSSVRTCLDGLAARQQEEKEG